MAMAGRHIRHDWQTFVNWDQKSVRTVCGKTTTWNAAGIPGVTEQPEVVEVRGRKVFGWCTLCAVDTYGKAAEVLFTTQASEIHPYISPMYVGVYEIVKPIYDAYRRRRATIDRPGFLR